MTTSDPASGDEQHPNNHAAFIWSVADLLRGTYKQSEYGKVILPLTVLRRLDCVLEPTKAAVLARNAELAAQGIANVDPVLCRVSGEQFTNTSPLTLRRVLDDPAQVADQLRAYIAGFSPVAAGIMEHFAFDAQISRLERNDLLYLVLGRFVEVDLHPDKVSNTEMGYLYEELLRKFSELSNETAGEHFTPREVITLMVDLLFAGDDDALARPGTKHTLFDPACGTGGMLAVATDRMRDMNPQGTLVTFGQELNAETYATCVADMMVKGQEASNIVLGNSFSEDGFPGHTFDYLLANPPFGVEWKSVRRAVTDEHDTLGFAGRFGAGLPRINDGSFLFLQHMIAKMRPVSEGGSRLAIVFNGSPLFTGAAGSGESEIRRWIIENDWLDAVVALPDQLFYNTGISTYFWIVTNRKPAERRGTVQLIDARESFTKMRKSLGEKRKELSAGQIAEVVRLYADHTEGDRVKILPNAAFGFLRVTVERPLRVRWEVSEETIAAVAADKKLAKLDDAVRDGLTAALEQHRGLSGLSEEKIVDAVLGDAPAGASLTRAQRAALADALAVSDPDGTLITDSKGNAKPDPARRDAENVPLPDVPVVYEADVTARLESPAYRDAIDAYLEAEVLPYVPDAWVDHAKTKIGYEIPLTRQFYTYVPPRPLAEIDAEIAAAGGRDPGASGRGASDVTRRTRVKYLYSIVDDRARSDDDHRCWSYRSTWV